MVIAGLLGAIYSIDGKRLAENYSATVITMLVATIGALFLLPLALLEGLRLDLPLPIWVNLLLLGLGAGALANLWWLKIPGAHEGLPRRTDTVSHSGYLNRALSSYPERADHPNHHHGRRPCAGGGYGRAAEMMYDVRCGMSNVECSWG